MSISYAKNLLCELTHRPSSQLLPPTVDNVRRTCSDISDSPDCLVKIDKVLLASFVDEMDVNLIKSSSHLMDNPIKFRDLSAEINYHVNLHLFNFGHGFRHPLHKICGCGAWQTMKKGIVALHVNSENGFIDAESLIKLSTENIDEFFQFPQEQADYAEEIKPLHDMILRVAHSTGTRLIDLGYASFADFIFDHSSGTQASAMRLVESLAHHFPAFNDRRYLRSGKEVLFLKKAQITVAEIYQKLGDALKGHISFGDIKRLTVACDNVLPCVLRTLGIITIPPELEKKIDNRQHLPAGDEEAHLRASAIGATELILQKANGSFWSKELGDYLWTLGKEPRFRKVERHATIDTCFY